jgi:NAD(P)-dependent dehydrogenase (short-subunit alcohol dehydrogenase family)
VAGALPFLLQRFDKVAAPRIPQSDRNTDAQPRQSRLTDGALARNYGRIVNIASIAGKEGNPNASAYAAAKAGVIAMTKAVGKELATYNIAVNAISPATAKTRILDELKPEFIDYMLSKIPRGRFVEVKEVANMVSWLVSEENSFTTASVFDLSGGRATY